MSNVDIILQNFAEIRRKSIKLWAGVTPELYAWRPDTQAFSFLEMVRHVLEIEYAYHTIVNNGGGHGDDITPWTGRPYTNVEDELAFAEPYRIAFEKTIREFSDDDLSSIQIVRSERATKTLGQFLQRCNYHESVHAGQFLAYLRTVGLDRPDVWD